MYLMIVCVSSLYLYFSEYAKLSLGLVLLLRVLSGLQKAGNSFSFLLIFPNSVHRSLASSSLRYKMNGFCDFLCLSIGKPIGRARVCSMLCWAQHAVLPNSCILGT